MVTFPNRLLISLIISNIPSNISCGVQSVLFVPTNTTTALSLTLKFNSPFCILHSTFSTLKKTLKNGGAHAENLNAYLSPPIPKLMQCNELILSVHSGVNCNCCTIESPINKTSDSLVLACCTNRWCYKQKKNKCLSKLGLISVASNWPVTTL